MDAREEELRKQLGIPMGADVTVIDLDAQREPPEVVTGGLTDTQIRNLPLEQIDQQINSSVLALEKLRETVSGEQARQDDLRLVRQRKLQLGGE